MTRIEKSWALLFLIVSQSQRRDWLHVGQRREFVLLLPLSGHCLRLFFGGCVHMHVYAYTCACVCTHVYIWEPQDTLVCAASGPLLYLHEYLSPPRPPCPPRHARVCVCVRVRKRERLRERVSFSVCSPGCLRSHYTNQIETYLCLSAS